MNDTVIAKAVQDAMVLRGGGMLEGGMCIGQYDVYVDGPLEQFRKECAEMQFRADFLRDSGGDDSFLRAEIYKIPRERKWEAVAMNHVTDEGVNHIWETTLRTAVTVVGPFTGLISSVGYSTTAKLDTQVSHAGWNEAGNGINYPNWSTPASNARTTSGFAAASVRVCAFTAVNAFIIATNGGVIKGCFIVTGTGAVVTNASTAGKLLSAGVFSGGDKTVSIADTVNVSYSITIS